MFLVFPLIYCRKTFKTPFQPVRSLSVLAGLEYTPLFRSLTGLQRFEAWPCSVDK